MENLKAVKIQAVKIDPSVKDSIEPQPPYKCFCCFDSGIVSSVYLSAFVEGKNDLPFLCARRTCETGKRFFAAYSVTDEKRRVCALTEDFTTQAQFQAQFDTRLAATSCEHLHTWGLEAWQKAYKNPRSIDVSKILGVMPKLDRAQRN